MINSNKNTSFIYFVLSVIVPIISIVIIFSLAYYYVKDEINIFKDELYGLKRVEQIQEIVFDMQKLRDFSILLKEDKKVEKNIQNVKRDILKKTSTLKRELKINIKVSLLKDKLFRYISSIEKDVKENTNFEDGSILIQESNIVLGYIAQHTKLLLDSELNSYLLMENLVTILPGLIEYNAQIRGLSSSISDGEIKDKRSKIATQVSKIEDGMYKLKFNISQLCSEELCIIGTGYKNMKNAQYSLISFTKKNILNEEKIRINSNDIFRLNSNNIEFITLFYKINVNELRNILNTRIDKKRKITLWIIFFGIMSIFFIGFINVMFFNKNKEFIKQIELLSITDGMTGLYNRRYFDNMFENQQKIHKRTKNNLVFIMIDIDHFKQYNDTYGHQLGDNTLISVAKSLKNDLNRPDDMVFRLGGEEFGILCSSMDEIKATSFANKLRVNINNLEIEHKNNSSGKFVTISMGIILIKPDCKYHMNSIYKFADEALYNAKQNGRNQVFLYNKREN